MAKLNRFQIIEKKLRRTLEKKVPQAVAEAGKQHFQESFELERYNEPGHRKWPDVKRRQQGSTWYGFKYGAKGKRPKKYGGGGHFSRAATTKAILKDSMSLKDSIFVKRADINGVEWASSSKYATIHNRGGKFRIFGKHSATMPKRQFMGTGTRLMGKIRLVVRKGLKQAMK